MATIDKDLLLDKIDRLLKLHNYAIEGWFANTIHNTVWDAPEIETDGDTIYRADAIEAIQNAYCKPCKEQGNDRNGVVCRACSFDDAIVQIDALPSADADRPKVVGIDYSPYRVQTTAPSAEAVSVEDEKQIENLILFKEYLRGRRDAVQGWIPCSERLPSYDGHYLVCVAWKYDNVEVLKWADGWNCYRNYDGKVDREHEIDGADIIAWMPLPEPYKGGDE